MSRPGGEDSVKSNLNHNISVSYERGRASIHSTHLTTRKLRAELALKAKDIGINASMNG
jgi:hypothetical protein